ncbi:MAG: hypothetical protein EGQ82_08110 [Clostridiales bacterium]|nr:hypothetical protein [Clostridiales bacterium]
MIIGIIVICIFAFAGCGNESTPPNQTTTESTEPSTSAASTEPAVSPESGLAAWGTTLHLSVPDGAVGVSVTRAVVNHLGQELSAEYDVPCSAAGEVTHTPFGGIFAAPCPDGTVYVRYSLVYAGADAPEEVTVRSAFPDFANSDLAELLAAALAGGDAEQALPSVSGDTAGDGNDKVVALWLTEDGIPFLTADSKVVLCLDACDSARYEGADMQALDLGDGRDAIVIVWGQLWDMALQCAVQDADGWRELPLPTPAAVATLSAPYRLDFTLPDGQMVSLDAREFDALAAFFDADGKPYRTDGAVTFRIDTPHEVVTLDGHAALRFTGYPILTGADADGTHEADFAALPMTLYIQNGEFRYACGALTAE